MIAAAGLALTVGVVAAAGNGFGAELMQQIDATPDQQEALKALRKDVREARQELRETRARLREQAGEATSGEDLDAERLHALVDEGAAAMAATLHASVDALEEAWGVLEPDQRSAARELIQERKAERKARRHKGQHPFRDRGLPRPE